MNKPDELFELIKSLDKPEKRYFKLYASKYSRENTNYIRLFNELEKQGSYDEKSLNKVFKGESFIRQLHVTKNYLYNLILSSLTEYTFRHSTHYKLSDQLRQVHTLFEKRLFPQAWQLVLRVKKTAEQTEDMMVLLDAIRWLRKIALRDEKKTYLSLHSEELAQKEDQLLESIQINVRLCRLCERAVILDNNSGRRLSPEEAHEWEQLMHDPYLANENPSYCYDSAYIYNQIHALYHMARNNFELASQYDKKNILLMEEKPYRIISDPARYIVALNNFLSTQRFLYKPEEFYKNLTKLKNLQNELPARLLSKEISARIFILSFLQEARFSLTLGKFDHIIELIEENQEKLQNDLVSRHLYKSLFYCIAIGAYFGAGNYRTALSYLNKLELETDALPVGTQCIYRVIRIIVYLELKHLDLIPYQIKTAIRFISKNKKVFKLESIFLHYIKRLFYTNSRKEMLAVFVDLRAELLTLNKDQDEARGFEYFDFISWLDSKIEGKPFADVVREKLAGHEYIVY